MIVDNSGALKDWSFSLLQGSFGLRPVITIDGNYDMGVQGQKIILIIILILIKLLLELMLLIYLH